MLQKRSLGMVETYVKFCSDHARGTTGVVAMIQVTGLLSVGLIKKSLELLQRRHPLLRAFLSCSADGQDFLEVDDEAKECPLAVIQRDHSDQWKQVYEGYLNEDPKKRQGYLWHATLLLNKNCKSAEHELIFLFHHTIIDGLSIGTLFRDLLNYHQTIADGNDPAIHPLPLLQSVDDLLTKKLSLPEHRERSEVAFSNLSSIGGHLYPYELNVPLHQRKTTAICREADKEQLARMIGICKQNGTTLTSLLTASLLVAVHRTKNGKNDEVARLQIATTPVNLRALCDPIVGEENIGCFVSAVTTAHSIGSETSLFDLARSFTTALRGAIQEQVYATSELDRQEYIEALGSFDKGLFSEKYHLGVGVTNYGLLDIPACSGPLQLKGFYSGAVRHWGDWLMLLHTASAGGKLSCCFCYAEPLLSKESADLIVKEFVSLLNSAVETR